jgi:hypothetical protein
LHISGNCSGVSGINEKTLKKTRSLKKHWRGKKTLKIVLSSILNVTTQVTAYPVPNTTGLFE